jgi:nitrate reductase gamma subunit
VEPNAVSAATKAADAVSAASAGGGTWQALAYFILVPMVYLALLVLAVGVAARLFVIFRSPANPTPLRTFPAARRPMLAALRDTFFMPQVRRHKPGLWVFLVLYHAAFVLLILGHLDLLPGISLVPESSRHMLGRGAIGVAVTASVLVFLVRRFRSPEREISTPGDYLLLLLLLFLFLLGDAMSWSNSWTAKGFVITKADVAAYVGSLARFSLADPRTLLPGSHYHFVVLHVLLANVLLITLPFTKIMHSFLALPVNALRRRER